MEQFKSWNCAISSLCQEIKGFTNEADSLKKELKIKSSEVFSGCFGRYNKMKAKFEQKENLQQFSRKNVPFAPLKQIVDERKTRKNVCLYLKLTLAIGLHQRYT